MIFHFVHFVRTWLCYMPVHCLPGIWIPLQLNSKVKFRHELIFGTIRTETRAQTCSSQTTTSSVINSDTSAFLHHGSLQLAGSCVVARMMSYDRISSSLAVAEGTRTHPFLLGFLPTFLELTRRHGLQRVRRKHSSVRVLDNPVVISAASHESNVMAENQRYLIFRVPAPTAVCQGGLLGRVLPPLFPSFFRLIFTRLLISNIWPVYLRRHLQHTVPVLGIYRSEADKHLACIFETSHLSRPRKSHVC
jgi:hypothetical protein